MNPAIVMGWHDSGCVHRKAALEWATRYWHHALPELPIVTAASTDGETPSRAVLSNRAVDIAHGAGYDVFLHVDPDSVVAPEQALLAFDLAADAGLVIAHDEFVYLDKPSTTTVLRRRPVSDPFGFQYGDEGRGRGGVGNAVVFTHATWQNAGGYDERFGMWGADDQAFALACGVLAGEQRRVEGPVMHLWHPRLPDSFPGHLAFFRSQQIQAEYRLAAEAGEDAMRALIERRYA